MAKVARCPDLVVEVLCLYLQNLYARNQPITIGVESVLAVQFKFRHLKGKLKGCWDVVTSWRSELPIRLRTPMPPQILSSLCRWALIRGLSTGGHQGCLWCSFAVGLMVGFWGLLRPCELTGLVRSCIKVPSDWVGEHAAKDKCVARLSLLMPKNWKYSGRQQISHISHSRTVQWLQWLCVGLPANMRPFPTLRQFRRMLRIALDALGLREIALSISSLRPGGASQIFAETRNVPAIQFLGRWRNAQSLHHYIQESMAAMVMFTVPVDAQKRMSVLEEEALFIDEPPPKPWQFFFTRNESFRCADAPSFSVPSRHHGSTPELLCRRASGGGRSTSVPTQDGSRHASGRGVEECKRDSGRRRSKSACRGCPSTARGQSVCQNFVGGPGAGECDEPGCARDKTVVGDEIQAAAASSTTQHFIGTPGVGPCSVHVGSESEASCDEGWTLSPSKQPVFDL